MVAIDAVYHTKCIVAFYNRARRLYSETEDNKENRRQHAIAFAELVSYLEDFREVQDTLPVFTLAELSKLYSLILENLGAGKNLKLHCQTSYRISAVEISILRLTDIWVKS